MDLSHLTLLVIVDVLGFGIQLLAFAYTYGRLTERVKTFGERLDKTESRIDRLEEETHNP